MATLYKVFSVFYRSNTWTLSSNLTRDAGAVSLLYDLTAYCRV